MADGLQELVIDNAPDKGGDVEPQKFDDFRIAQPTDKLAQGDEASTERDTSPAISPLVGAKVFEIMEGHGEPNNWAANGERGQELIESSYDKIGQLANLPEGVIKGTSADNAVDVNNWLARENMDIRLQDQGKGLYLAAKMQINTEFTGGKPRQFESQEGGETKSYEGFIKPSKVIEVDGKQVVVLNDDPSNGPLIYLTPTEGKVTGSEANAIGEKIAGAAEGAKEVPGITHVHMANSFINHQGDIKELVGAVNLETGTEINQAKLQTIDWTNKDGAGFVQAAAVAASRGIERGPEDSQIYKLDSEYVKTYVIPGVGAVASVPVGREDWKNPPKELIEKFGGK